MPRRRLGYIETLCALGHDHLHGAAQGVSTATVTGPLTRPLVAAALACVQARHPLLRARLVGDGDGHAFVVANPAPPIQLVVRPRVDADEWRAVEAHEYAAPVDPAVALWRVTVLLDPAGSDHTVIVVFHHAIADGVARLLFHDDLLRACAALTPNDAAFDMAATLPAVTARPLPPPIESSLQGATSWAAFQAAIAADAADRPTPDPWPYARAVPVAARAPQMLLRALEPPVLAALHARTRAAGTTVNAALAAAMLRTAARLAGGRLTTSLATSINLRAHADPPLEQGDFGCFMVNVRTHHAVAAADDLLALARAYREQLQARTPAQAHTPVDFDVADLRARLDPDVIERATAYPFRLGLSNLGVYPHPPAHGAFALTRIHVSTSRRAGLYAGFLHAVTLRGRMQLGLSFVTPLLDAAWAAAFMDGVVAELA